MEATSKSTMYERILQNSRAEHTYHTLLAGTAIGELSEREILGMYQDICMDHGIFAFGYGPLPASVLLDKRMRSPYAIALLGLVCAQAGENNLAILARSAACGALGISKATFTKNMNRLVQYGYIHRNQPQSIHFQTTEYRLTRNNMKTEENTWVNLKRASQAGVIRNVSFPASQFGNIPKLVMYNDRLSVPDKAVYIVLLLMGGYHMTVTARRDFIGELVGIKNPDIISRCMKNLEAAGLILRAKENGRNSNGTEYTVLLIPSTEPSIPRSWVKHDLLKIIQTQAYQSLLNRNDFMLAVCDYTKKRPDRHFAVPASEELFAEQAALKAKLTLAVDEAIIDFREARKEANEIAWEQKAAERRRAAEMAARGMSAAEIFDELCALTLSVPHMKLNGNTILSEKNYDIIHGNTEADKTTRDILSAFASLPQYHRSYLRTRLGAEVPAEICTGAAQRESASEYAAERLSGVHCEGKLDLMLIKQFQSTLLDGINRPSRLGYHGVRVKSTDFCAWISNAEKKSTVRRIAEDAMRSIKEKFKYNAADIRSCIAYIRTVFLNALTRAFYGDESPYSFN